VLSDIPPQADDRILVDFRTSDDAGVYRWDAESALVQTVDFFTPIVDDPFTYGEIAAANALSDIYAMGGRPITALAIAGFPKDGLEREVIAAIFRGGFEMLRKAEVALLGGHTVQDPEIKFGYAVTGVVDPGRVLSNARARPGDVLFLTKPLGTGVVATALKFERIAEEAATAAIQSMRMLNRDAAQAMLTNGGVSACTDITGFGLAGHAVEVAAASDVSLVIDTASVPMFDGVYKLVGENKTRGMGANREYFSPQVEVRSGVDPVLVDLCYDPQTSGGLLISVAAADADALAGELARRGVQAARVGEVTRPQASRVVLSRDSRS
jgi:selenide,water dikinase